MFDGDRFNLDWHLDDDIAGLALGFDVAMRLDDLGERISPIGDGTHRAGIDKFVEHQAGRPSWPRPGAGPWLPASRASTERDVVSICHRIAHDGTVVR